MGLASRRVTPGKVGRVGGRESRDGGWRSFGVSAILKGFELPVSCLLRKGGESWPPSKGFLRGGSAESWAGIAGRIEAMNTRLQALRRKLPCR